MAMKKKTHAHQMQEWVGKDMVEIVSAGSWPGHLLCESPSGQLRLAAHMGPIGSSKRKRDEVERRFQNPGKNCPVVAPKGEIPVLLGMAEIKGKRVLVGMDAEKRIGKTTRQSLFMPASLIKSGIEKKWAEHTNTVGERIIAFAPPLLPLFVEAYQAQRKVTPAEIRAALRWAREHA